MKTAFAGMNRAYMRIFFSYFILEITALKIFIKTLVCDNGFFWLFLGHGSQIPCCGFCKTIKTPHGAGCVMRQNGAG